MEGHRSNSQRIFVVLGCYLFFLAVCPAAGIASSLEQMTSEMSGQGLRFKVGEAIQLKSGPSYLRQGEDILIISKGSGL